MFKFDLAYATHGLFPDCVGAKSDVQFTDEDSLVIIITLAFEHEFDIEDRTDAIRVMCERVRLEWTKFVDIHREWPELEEYAVAVMVKFESVAHEYRNN